TGRSGHNRFGHRHPDGRRKHGSHGDLHAVAVWVLHDRSVPHKILESTSTNGANPCFFQKADATSFDAETRRSIRVTPRSRNQAVAAARSASPIPHRRKRAVTAKSQTSPCRRSRNTGGASERIARQ